MQIINRGIIFIVQSSEGERREMTDTRDWARSIGKEVEEREQKAIRRAQNVAMQRDIIAEEMPLRLEELYRAFQACCETFNEINNPERKLAFFRTGSSNFMVRPDALDEIVSGEYDSQTKRIKITTPAGTDIFLPMVNLEGAGSCHLVSYSTGRATTPEKIAQDAIRHGIMRG